MREVPVDRLRNARRETLGGFPAELALQFVAVDGIAAVVSGSVRDVRDLRGVRFTVRTRRLFVEEPADRLHDLDVRFFVQTTDVIGLADAPTLQHEPDRGGVI